MLTSGKINKVADKHEREVSKAFVADARAALEGVTIKEIAEHIEDHASLNQLLAIDAGAIGNTLEAVRDAYKNGGELQAPEVKINFSMHSDRAAKWIAKRSSKLVTRINRQQQDAIRIVLSHGVEAGRNPRQTALDIVGRVGRSGKREGGIVGLNDNQARYVMNARQQLLSGDPEQMREYLNRKRRDRRFDHIVKKAIAAEKPVTHESADKIITRYEARLLQTRGETIARTETIEALNAGRHEALHQAADKGIISERHTKKVWDSTSHHFPTRDLHIQMDGQSVDMEEPFVDADGNRMMYPGDTSMGAAADTVINCRCTMRTEIDFIGAA